LEKAGNPALSARLDAKGREAPLVDHSIVRQHRDSGCCSVVVNPPGTVGIVGMSEAENDALLVGAKNGAAGSAVRDGTHAHGEHVDF
jgi:hypothetical protein